MNLPNFKTKIVATIGPASSSPDVLRSLIRAGVNVARLNFSHGDFETHGQRISDIRAAASAENRRVAIMADLPGPKMRLGEIEPGPIHLEKGAEFTLTNEKIVGDSKRVSMTFEPLPRVVKPGDRLFLNDGLVQLLVREISGSDVRCEVAVGGVLSSRKGLNLPRIALGISAFTEHDKACLAFALSCGVDAISQSFVESAKDMQDLRDAAGGHGKSPFLIAKIERLEALERYDEILEASDGVMIARGDLGVEVPIEEMAITQKRLIARANFMGKPVITATQMLESMTTSRLPTRAEATDVANAILDGTDAVMLSGESAVGAFPEEAVCMLGKIAAATESHRTANKANIEPAGSQPVISNQKSLLVEQALKLVPCDAILVPTQSGTTARIVARSRPSVWILAVGPDPHAMQSLSFSSGVHACDLPEEPADWNSFARSLTLQLGLDCKRILLVAGPSKKNPHANQRLEVIAL